MKKRLIIYLVVAAGIVGTLFFLWVLGQSSSENRPLVVSPNVQIAAESTVSERDLTLYYASRDATQLVSTVSRFGCSDEISCLRAAVEALIRGPVDAGLPVIPARTRLHSVRVEEDLAILDFDAQLVDGHPGGSQSELLTVYALANTVAVNFPHVRQLQITIEGVSVATLKGHVDLRRPLLADFTYSKRNIETEEK